MTQLKRHLENEKLIDPNQSADRALHSTETCLLKTTNEILFHLDRDNLVIVLGLDLSAAFDTIDFDILDILVCFLLNYTEFRTQHVDSFLD